MATELERELTEEEKFTSKQLIKVMNKQKMNLVFGVVSMKVVKVLFLDFQKVQKVWQNLQTM